MTPPKHLNAVAVVPVYNPEPALSGLCAGLLGKFETVLVIDDGSDRHVEDFAKLPKEVEIVRHAANCGKGRAIKTACAWVVKNRPGVRGVVFADGDGQHLPEDVCRVAERMRETDAVVLGVRDFARDVPLRSRIGNISASFLIRTFFRIPIRDSQTGLRAIPSRLLGAMCGIAGERYEYEIRLFGLLHDLDERLEQVRIETVYLSDNRASHFRPVADSLRVCREFFGMALSRFFRFSLFSLLAFVVDNAVFSVSLFGLRPLGLCRRDAILYSLVAARVISASLNCLCNGLYVFHARCGWAHSCLRYALLALANAAASYAGTLLLSTLCDAQGLLITALKIVVEVVLFVVSYEFQVKWVFKEKT